MSILFCCFIFNFYSDSSSFEWCDFNPITFYSVYVCLSVFCSFCSVFYNMLAPLFCANTRMYGAFNVYQLKTVGINLTFRLTLNELIFIIIVFGIFLLFFALHTFMKFTCLFIDLLGDVHVYKREVCVRFISRAENSRCVERKRYQH